MITDTSNGRMQREPALLDQTVVLVGGSAGIGLETARRARAEGADVVLTGRDPDRLAQAAKELDARSTAAFDAADPGRLAQFFDELPSPIDHVMVTAGAPYYSSLADMDFARAHRNIDEHLFLALHVARESTDRVRPGGTLLFMSGTGGRRRKVGLSLISAMTAAMPALTASLALELAPVRVNLIAPASWTHRCPPSCSATSWTRAATSCGQRFPSGASSDRPMSLRSPYTS